MYNMYKINYVINGIYGSGSALQVLHRIKRVENKRSNIARILAQMC